MVEGGLIDVAHHKNNAKRALEETLEFEKAVKVQIVSVLPNFIYVI
jgi:alkaline phosphatase